MKSETEDDKLEALLLEGLENGEHIELTGQFWGALRRELKQSRNLRSKREKP